MLMVAGPGLWSLVHCLRAYRSHIRVMCKGLMAGHETQGDGLLYGCTARPPAMAAGTIARQAAQAEQIIAPPTAGMLAVVWLGWRAAGEDRPREQPIGHVVLQPAGQRLAALPLNLREDEVGREVLQRSDRWWLAPVRISEAELLCQLSDHCDLSLQGVRVRFTPTTHVRGLMLCALRVPHARRGRFALRAGLARCAAVSQSIC